MFQLNCKITIKGDHTWEFNRINSCEINLSSETLTDTCTLTLPKKVKWENANKIPLKRGDAITVALGYGEDLRVRFVGFIRSVSVKTPIVVQCEDWMWKLKQTSFENKPYDSATIGQILKDILPPDIATHTFGEQNIGSYRTKQPTVAAELDNLKKNGIQCFFKLRDEKPVLYCGTLFDDRQTPKPVFREGLNIITNTTDYKRAEEVNVKIKATSISPDNKIFQAEVGDEQGAVRTMFRYNLDEQALRSWAEQEHKHLKCDGLYGSFTTFGVPEIDKEDHILLETEESIQTSYAVKSVAIKFDAEGYRQTITLDRQIWTSEKQ